jgi:hypothetical protein
MKLPYGISDFEKLRTGNYLYIDKTYFIEKIENLSAPYLFFIRPRRFGKSLFLSTLAHYYDQNTETNFEQLFGDLYIGKNPTRLKNSYLVLKLNFSGLNTENKTTLNQSFQMSITNAIIKFFDSYSKFFGDYQVLQAEIKKTTDLRAMLDLLGGAVQKTGKKVYLIIDEYDHFANDIIAMGDGEFYREIVRARGFVRDFYETVKIGTESFIDRIFITGISPVMLDDLTSGFNITSNITMDENINDMLGFTDTELQGLLDRLAITKEDIRIRLKEYFNGYLFNANCQERLFNPDMILFYLDQLLKTKKPPQQLIDDNVKTDYGRLNRLVANEANRKVLDEIIKNEGITADIVSKFSFDRMYDEGYFVSLLFYMGMLTIDRREKTRLLLKVPNYVIKTIYWEYIEHRLKDEYWINLQTETLRRTIEDLAYEGRIEPYIAYISGNVLKMLSNRDTVEFDEKYLKVILFAYLTNSRAYRAVSEREVESGYLDIYLERDPRMPDVKYEWLLELKYLKKSEKARLEQVKEQGLAQLRRYAKARDFEGKRDLKKALLIFIGKDEYMIVSDD